MSSSAWPGTPTAERIASPARMAGEFIPSRSGTRQTGRATSSRSRPVGRVGVLRRGVQPRRPIPGHGEERREPCKSGTRRTGRQVGTLGTHDREIRGVVFSRDGRHLASASGDGEVKLWDATRLDEKQEARQRSSTGAGPRAELERGVQPGRPAAGRRAARRTRSRSGTWRPAGRLQTLRGHSGDVYAVAFSPDRAGGSPRRVRTAP